MTDYNGILSLLLASLEFLLLVNAYFFAEKNETNKIAFTVLFFLFGYQFFETLICAFEIKNRVTIGLAFIDITFLPPLGLLLAVKFFDLPEKFARAVFYPFYAIILYFVYEIIFGNGAFVNTDCTPFLAGYHYPFEKYYGIFYYLPVLGTLYLLIKNRRKIENERKKAYNALLAGYVLAFVPYFLFYPFIGSLSDYYESLLCKEAFLLALFLAYFTLVNKMKKALRRNETP